MREIDIIVKNNSGWFTGYMVNNYMIQLVSEIKKLSDVPNINEYITLGKHLQKCDVADCIEYEICYELEISSMYVLRNKKYWWNGLCEICKLCVNECRVNQNHNLIYCGRKRII